MKTIGLVAGMSWHSSLDYYRLVNEMVNKKMGGLHSAKIVMVSLDFAEIAKLIDSSDWTEVAYILVQAGNELEFAGAETLLLCSNAIHYAIPEIKKFSSLQFLHIADAAAKKVVASKISKVGLLGTKFTMEQNFYRDRLKLQGLEVVIPEIADRDFINKVIFEELCLGIVNPDSRERFISIIDSLVKQGARGIILGCTEIPLLVTQEDVSIPIFDTLLIHAEAAVEFALS